MDSSVLSLAQACARLRISVATGRNWLRLGKLIPDRVEDGTPLFTEAQIARLTNELYSENGSRLKSRRNKKYVSGSRLYRSYISSGCTGIASVEQTLSLFSASGLKAEEPVIRSLLADAAVQMLCLCHGFQLLHLPEYLVLSCSASRSADAPLHGLIPHPHRELLEDLIGDRKSALLFTENHPELFTADYPLEPEEDICGLLYLSLQNLGTRKSTGSYYTPTRIVRQLIRHTEGSAYLDPCCGSGNFLLQLPDSIPVSRIYGCDIDPVSVMLTRINLALKFPGTDPGLLKEHITQKDFLTVLPSEMPDADIILGNPPWGYDYSSMQINALKKTFRSAKGRHPESCDLFLEQALRCLPSGGRVSFVLPEALLNVRSHQKIREILSETADIEYLDYLGEVFDRVQCPSIILQIQKTGHQMSGSHIKVSIENKKAFTINEERIVDPSVFSFIPDDREYRILRKMDTLEGALSLKDNSVFALGIVTGNNRELITDERKEGWEPVLRGPDLRKYRYAPSGSYIRWDPDSFQQCAPAAAYRAPEKLLYRFICSQPVFAYDDRQTLSLNSANILIPQIEGLSCRYILAVLNSRPVQFYLEKTFRSVKLLRSHIEQIPIPPADTETQQEITLIMEPLLHAEGFHTDNPDAGSTDSEAPDTGSVPEIYNTLDKRIALLYHLSEEDYRIILDSTVPRFLP